jgi:hypothetical protein
MTPDEADAIVERLTTAIAATLVELEEAGGDWSSWTTGFDSGMRVALERPALARELVEALAIRTFTEGDDPAAMAVLAVFRDPRPSMAALEAGILYLQAIAGIPDPEIRRRRASEVGAELGMAARVFGDVGEILDRLRREGVL